MSNFFAFLVFANFTKSALKRSLRRGFWPRGPPKSTPRWPHARQWPPQFVPGPQNSIAVLIFCSKVSKTSARFHFSKAFLLFWFFPVCSQVPEEPPKTPRGPSRAPQEPPESSQETPKSPQGAPKEPPRGPTRSPRGTQVVPRGPTRSTRGTQVVPRGPSGTSRGAPIGQRDSQGPPETPHKTP